MGLETALLIGGTVLSTVNEQNALSGQEDAAQAKADLETQQLQLQIDQERTQAALEARGREEKLTRALAAQRAAFGGVVEASSGSPLRLQEVTTGSINREGSLADLESGNRIANINAEKGMVSIGLQAKKNSIRSQKNASLIDAGMTIGGSFGGGGGGTGGETIYWRGGGSTRI